MKTYKITAENIFTKNQIMVGIAAIGNEEVAARVGLDSLKSMGYTDLKIIKVELAPDNTNIGIL